MHRGVGRLLLTDAERSDPVAAPRRSAFVISAREVLTALHCLRGAVDAQPGAGRTRAVVAADRSAPADHQLWFHLPLPPRRQRQRRRRGRSETSSDTEALDVPMKVAWQDEALDVALLVVDRGRLSPAARRRIGRVLARNAMRPSRRLRRLDRVTITGFSRSMPRPEPVTWSGRVTDVDGLASNRARAINVHVDQAAASTAPTVRGLSGGPVQIRQRRAVVGVVREYVRRGDGALGGDLQATAMRDVIAASPRVRALVARRGAFRGGLCVVTLAALVCAVLVVPSGQGETSPSIRNRSNRAGGELRMVLSAETDRFHLTSLDPAIGADSPLGVNLQRELNRTLVTFRSGPGTEPPDLVGDLAQSTGTPTDNATTWTYTLRSGLVFDDGTAVRADDVRYAVERSFASNTVLGGRRLPGADVRDFRRLLLPAGAQYPGPFEAPGGGRLSSISTPDDRTIVFHLSRPCADWDRYMALPVTAPVPRLGRDTGASYGKRPASTGPYRLQSLDPGTEAVLVRNARWDRKADGARSALPDRIVIRVLPDQDAVDGAVINGDADIDIGHSGVVDPTRSEILTRTDIPEIMKRSDVMADASSWFLSVVTSVAPLDNIHCREAIFRATDTKRLVDALGGAQEAARPAGSLAVREVLTPLPADTLAGRYPYGGGRVQIALDACGHPDGFSVTVPVRRTRTMSDNRNMKIAMALTESLRKYHIIVNIQVVEPSEYDAIFGWGPDIARQRGWGLVWSGIEPLVVSPYGYFWAFHSDRPEGENSNATQFTSPDLDRLIDRASEQTDPDLARPAWEAVNRKMLDLAIVLPVAQIVELRVTSERTTNVYPLRAIGQIDVAALGVVPRTARGTPAA
ncbi:ABC transporter substrate-binding protein [Parafrankia sp. EUN1f]|uniref:ABC transporter substrate-binding protein n=1 Tax=Parafrankia sp. EUN1f TaxID=102897 RepID=UPI0001C451F5|nr:ABC transporter substrate-binding protein [Parafrankia sp. EUN1f]EFC82832.1 extracellular solute-binding protein family 5 [Parafrankia sp. EUN1f]